MVDIWACVIAGGAAAGCVPASRLSASLSTKILLIEAGQDTPPDSLPADIPAPYPLAYDTNLTPHLLPRAGLRRSAKPAQRGRATAMLRSRRQPKLLNAYEVKPGSSQPS
jgi:choline dehydrogenase-like flavoprotein